MEGGVGDIILHLVKMGEDYSWYGISTANSKHPISTAGFIMSMGEKILESPKDMRWNAQRNYINYSKRYQC